MTETIVKPSSKTIIAATARAFDVDPDDITGPSRIRHVVEARRVAIALILKLRSVAKSEIGRIINRDHSTVLHNLRAFDAANARSPKLAATVAAIERRLLPGVRDRPTQADFEVLAGLAPKKVKSPPAVKCGAPTGGQSWDDDTRRWWSENNRLFSNAMMQAHPELAGVL